MASVPKTAKTWRVAGTGGARDLNLSEETLPQVGEMQVLVKIQGAALNPRDTIISEGAFPWSTKPNVVPGSDGAGTVLAVGPLVTRFKPGDKVVTVINPSHTAGPVMTEMLERMLGATLDGTFRTAGVFDEQALVRMPEGLTFTEAATLSCAGVTAWNAVFGLPGRKAGPGQWAVTIGTGGVSLFALQFAKAAGARVIALTSSEDKSKLLRKLGADHVINYKETPDWGAAVKALTGGLGADIVLDVAGPRTLAQSARAVRLEGLLVVLGFVGGPSDREMPALLDVWLQNFTARGLWAGSRQQMEDMCRAVEANPDKLRPVIDNKVFALEQLKEAYEYLGQGKHVGKVCIKIS